MANGFSSFYLGGSMDDQADLDGESGLDVVAKPILEIIYQDKYLVAVNKPAGLFVHRSFMDKNEIYFALQLVRDQIGQYVYPVHRLDKPTSGILLFALSAEVARLMGQCFTDKAIKKTILRIDSWPFVRL